MNLSLTDELRAFVDAKSGDGTMFATPSEFVRSVLRECKAREEAAQTRDGLVEGFQDVLASAVILGLPDGLPQSSPGSISGHWRPKVEHQAEFRVRKVVQPCRTPMTSTSRVIRNEATVTGVSFSLVLFSSLWLASACEYYATSGLRLNWSTTPLLWILAAVVTLGIIWDQKHKNSAANAESKQ